MLLDLPQVNLTSSKPAEQAFLAMKWPSERLEVDLLFRAILNQTKGFFFQVYHVMFLPNYLFRYP